MVSCEMVVRSVQVCWRDEFAAAPTIYPGQQLDTSGLAGWVELWVDAWDEPVRRDISPDRQWVWLSVHCFTREPLGAGAGATRVHNLEATVRGIISRRTIDVRDFSLSGEPPIARLRMREAEARDLTREEGAADRGVLRHIVVMCRGRLEEVVP